MKPFKPGLQPSQSPPIEQAQADHAAGFTSHQSHLVDDCGYSLGVALLLPTQLAHTLALETKKRLAAEIEAEDLKRDQAAAQRILTSGLETPSTTPPETRSPVLGWGYDPKVQHIVYTPSAPRELFTKAGRSVDKDIRKRDEELSKQLAKASTLRDIAEPESAVEDLEYLRFSQPHFSAVIDLIRDQLLLAQHSNRGPRIPPILLDGAPGLGKTHFAFELAKALGTSIRRISFDSAISGATLLGSERRWANTQYGVLFDLVCLGKHANPIVILDEIDKSGTNRQWDPLAPLHTLLEPSTASKVRDISLDFEFDASMVTWIATANNKMLLPETLRSRLREFHIEKPDAEGAIRLASSVVYQTIEGLELYDFEEPKKDLAVALAHLTAREIRQATEQAVGHAIAHGRHRVTVDDLPAEIRDEAINGRHGVDDREASGNPKGKSWLH